VASKVIRLTFKTKAILSRLLVISFLCLNVLAAAGVITGPAVKGYKPMPILFNEDDHFDFGQPAHNLVAAVKAYASWGYFDYRLKGEGYDDGFQSVPVNWQISSPRKMAFFEKLREITGGWK